MIALEHLIEKDKKDTDMRIAKFDDYTKTLANFVLESSLSLLDLYKYCSARIKNWYHADGGVNVVLIFENFLDGHKFFKRAWMNDKNAKKVLAMAIREIYNAYKTYYIVFTN